MNPARVSCLAIGLTSAFLMSAVVQAQVQPSPLLIPAPPAPAAESLQVGDAAATPTPAVRPVFEGPLHEAFLSPARDRQAAPVAKAPPMPIAERPGVDPPSPRAQWIEGYWEWDTNRDDYVWVTGCWRVPPPGKFWVNGFWKRGEQGYYRVPGFWSDRQTDRIDYRKNGPPEGHPDDEPGPAPGEDYFYVPGHYEPDGDGVVWKPGFWAKAQTGWAWVPAQWVHQPEGWVFQRGYWDRTLEDRGTLFTPAETTVPADQAENGQLVYQPMQQVSPASYGRLYGAFGRPTAYYDGYPGCYYDPSGNYYGYAGYGSLGLYGGYLDYPYVGTIGYPYLTTAVGGYGYGYPGMYGYSNSYLGGLGFGLAPLLGYSSLGYGYGYPGYGYGLGNGGYGFGGYGYGLGLLGIGRLFGLGLGYGIGYPGFGLGYGLGLGYGGYGLGYGGTAGGYGLGYGGYGLGYGGYGLGGYGLGGYGFGYPFLGGFGFGYPFLGGLFGGYSNYGNGYSNYGNGYGYRHNHNYRNYPYYPGHGQHHQWAGGHNPGWGGGQNGGWGGGQPHRGYFGSPGQTLPNPSRGGTLPTRPQAGSNLASLAGHRGQPGTGVELALRQSTHAQERGRPRRAERQRAAGASCWSDRRLQRGPSAGDPTHRRSTRVRWLERRRPRR